MQRLKRPVFMLLGLIFTAIGVAAAFLPVLPSTVFLIAAVYFFARSSPAMEAWILEHNVLGPPVLAWRDHGAIPRRAKYFAFSGMAFGFFCFLYFAQPSWLLLLPVTAFFAYGAWYVGSRPDGPAEE